MPHVTLLGPPSLWQKLKGDTPTYRIGTVWKLMNYEASAASIEVPPTVTDSSAAPGQVPPADES